MNRTLNIRNLCATALLIAIGVAIPMYSPLKVVIPPMSYTIASHVAIFVAMFISPGAAIAVTLGTTLGFYFGIPNPVIVARAASHIGFALLGSWYLSRHPIALSSHVRMRIFSFLVAVLHGAMEVAVVSWFYAGGRLPAENYQLGFYRYMFLMVGVGSIVHSMVDFELSLAVIRVLKRQRYLGTMFMGLAPETKKPV